MKLNIGYSSCPNDTFIFYAMVHGKIDTEGIEFSPVIKDVEELNRKAFNRELAITKLSYHAYAYIADSYLVLDAGSALGRGNGPLLLSKKVIAPEQEVLQDLKIAIPGKYTTANMLLGIAFPGLTDKPEYIFSDIEEAVLKGEVDAGLAIHENRFTYEARGLKKIIDLGQYWEDTYDLPIPLGGIMISSSQPFDIIDKVNRIMKRSVEYAFANTEDIMPYVKQYAQEMDEEVMLKHIGLYVNNFTLDLGEGGKNAIRKMLEIASEKRFIPELPDKIFVSS